jgi:hypothetical protein
MAPHYKPVIHNRRNTKPIKFNEDPILNRARDYRKDK